MTHLPYDICLRLRDAGLPQPGPCEGQLWYLPFMGVVNGVYLPYLINYLSMEQVMVYFSGVGVPVQYKTHLGAGLAPKAFEGTTKIFCPDAEYLLDHLPDTLKIEKYNKQWMLMVKGEYQLQDNLAHAAALAYLHLHEKTPAP